MAIIDEYGDEWDGLLRLVNECGCESRIVDVQGACSEWQHVLRRPVCSHLDPSGGPLPLDEVAAIDLMTIRMADAGRLVPPRVTDESPTIVKALDALGCDFDEAPEFVRVRPPTSGAQDPPALATTDAPALVGVWWAGTADGRFIDGAQAIPAGRQFRSTTLWLRSDETYTLLWRFGAGLAHGEVPLGESGPWGTNRWSVTERGALLRLETDPITGGEATYELDDAEVLLTGHREYEWGRLQVRLRLINPGAA